MRRRHRPRVPRCLPAARHASEALTTSDTAAKSDGIFHGTRTPEPILTIFAGQSSLSTRCACLGGLLALLPAPGCTVTDTGDGGRDGGASEEGGGARNDAGVTCDLPTPATTGVAKPSGTPGALSILDWAGYKGAVSYTFDDANSTQIDNYDALSALGVRMTFYLISSKQSASDDIWKRALSEGHELGNHTAHHCNTSGCSGVTDLAADTDSCTSFLQTTYGITPHTMSAPYGADTYAEVASTRFLINRGVSGGSIAPGSEVNPFNLPCHIPAPGANATALNAVLDAAHNGGKWQIMLVHGFTGGSDGAYQPIALSEFVASVEHAKSLGGLWLDTVVRIGAYFRAQKALSATTPATSGENTTWSWTLPANFPPGQCLRVTVAGGTLTQDGKALPWNEHGYYEISLDQGALTLSP